MNWNANALALIRDAVVEAFGKMGVTFEVDERLESPSPFFNQWIRQRKGEGLTHLERRGKGLTTGAEEG